MTAPNWIDAVVRDFGRGAGIDGFALNSRGAAAVSFENGFSLRFKDGDTAAMRIVEPDEIIADMMAIIHSLG